MCFYVENPKNPNAKIAKEDIIVYKILKDAKGGWGYSLYRSDTLWQRGGFLESKIKFERDGQVITEGLHACLTYKDAKNHLSCFPSSDESIQKFIIPKGSTYYTNESEIVSDKMGWATRGYFIQRFFNKLFKNK
jgi:hypothetical protein